ncbi:MAG TPA: PAS domain S-box protein [Nitrospiraceae bacterium]|nr:PAS domain S-box protein [Nitrospiraceae bacterium]
MSPVGIRWNGKLEAGLWYERFIQHLPASLLSLGPTGHIISVNSTALKLLRYASSEDLEDHVHLVDLCVDVQAGETMLQRLSEIGTLDEYPLELKCGDGTTRDVAVSCQGFHDEQDGVRAWCLLQDISSQSASRSLLVKLDARYQALLEATGEGLYGIDTEGRCLFLNDVGSLLLGVSPDELKDRPMQELIRYRQQDPEAEESYRPFHPGVTCPAEGQVWWRYGEKLSLVEYSSYPIVEEGELTGTVVSFCDLTARRKTIQTFHDSVSLFRGLTERSRQVYWILNVRTDRIDYVSPGYEAIWGRRCAEVYESRSLWIEAVHPDDRNRVAAHRVLAAEKDGYDIEYRIVRPDGEIRWIHERAFPLLDGSRSVCRVAGIAEDITKYKRVTDVLESTLAQMRALSSHTERTREEERMRIGQEVHDDLGGVLTYLKLDLGRMAKSLSRETGDLSEQLQKRMTAMIEAIDSAIVTVQRIAIELRPVVLEQFGLASALIWQAMQFERRTGIRCRCHTIPRLNDIDKQRALLLFRIIQEALTNIARHAHASIVDITGQERGEDLSIVVQDNGKGIPDKAVSDPASFGLRGMQERARLAGATLTIEGHPGAGTTLAVHCPMKATGAKVP